jgi:flavin reductase (DIM6/NTAB) family NADH-FMN oxidoreductase RutF
VIAEDPVVRVMHELPYGLYIIGSKEADDSGKVNGMMADWVMQVSFNPRLVAVAFENDAHTLGNVRKNGVFTVNLLAADKESMDVARPFAQPHSGTKVKGRKGEEATAVHYKLDGLGHTLSEHGAPVLDAAMAWLECEAEQYIDIGDHTLVIARVLDGRVEREAEPMTSTYTGWTYSG